MTYDSPEQRDVLLRMRARVDAFQPQAILALAAEYPGVDFNHPVGVMNTPMGVATEQFEPLAYRCIRLVRADVGAGVVAGADAPWIAAGFDTFRALVATGSDPGSRNNQGFSSLDFAVMALSFDPKGMTHRQGAAFQGFVLDCLAHMVGVGMDIDTPSWTTPLGRMLCDYPTPRKALEAIIEGDAPERARAGAQEILMGMGVDHPTLGSRPGVRF